MSSWVKATTTSIRCFVGVLGPTIRIDRQRANGESGVPKHPSPEHREGKESKFEERTVPRTGCRQRKGYGKRERRRMERERDGIYSS